VSQAAIERMCALNNALNFAIHLAHKALLIMFDPFADCECAPDVFRSPTRAAAG
jgi:hypothetical protein